MPTTQTPTPESHPFQVGKMVYANFKVALEKAEIACDTFPETDINIVDRRTGEVVLTLNSLALCDEAWEGEEG